MLVAHQKIVIKVASHFFGRNHQRINFNGLGARRLPGQDGQLHAAGNLQLLLQTDQQRLLLHGRAQFFQQRYQAALLRGYQA